MKTRLEKGLLCGLLGMVLIFLALSGCGKEQESLVRTALLTDRLASAAPIDAQRENAPNPADAVTSDTETRQITVYVTETGEKYHRGDCAYLAKSRISMTLDAARRSYGPCSKCGPPA